MKTPIALLLSAFLATAAFASGDDFTRGSGGEVSMLTKQRQSFSGSISAATSGSLSFGSGGLTLGGPLVRDTMWFFASAQRIEPMFASRYAVGQRDLDTGAAKIAAHLGERQNVDASYFRTGPQALTVPSTFLSLRYTGIVSDRMFFTASVSQRRAD